MSFLLVFMVFSDAILEVLNQTFSASALMEKNDCEMESLDALF
jgi:hypothetical protein